jgi:hypothetical protein
MAMGKRVWWLLPIVILVVCGLLPTPVVAAQKTEQRPDASPDGEEGWELQEMPEAQVPAGQVRRFLVTYMNSQRVAAIRSATVVSVTNQSLTASCSISVDWFRGASAFNAPVCTTNITVAPGRTVDHCSRPLPDAITACNATCNPALTFDEGRAVISSTNAPECSRVASSARVYYTTGSGDSGVSAITDSKILRFGLPNTGD